MVECLITDNPHLVQEALDHYEPLSDEVARSHLQFLLLLRRDEAKAKLFAASRLSRREGFVSDLAAFYGEPRKPDELGAIAHFLDIDPNQVESCVEQVNQKLLDRKPRRRRRSSTKVA